MTNSKSNLEKRRILRTPNELQVGDEILHEHHYHTILEITQTGRGWIQVRLSVIGLQNDPMDDRNLVKIDSLTICKLRH